MMILLMLALHASAAAAPSDSATRVERAPYRIFVPSGPGSVARLEAKLGPERFLEILKLNRLDRAHALSADTLVLPAPSRDASTLSPWPRRIESLDSIPKIVLVALRVQTFAAYGHGSLARWGPISSGGPNAPSRTGLYFVVWKDRLHRSSVDSTWIMPWTVNIDRDVGTALHQYALPGLPASHCCIRLLEEDAAWVYGWVDTWKVSEDGRSVLAQGTPVVLIGEYDYLSAPPWKRLPKDEHAADVTPEDITSALRFLHESE